jgi:hypothetical protein
MPQIDKVRPARELAIKAFEMAFTAVILFGGSWAAVFFAKKVVGANAGSVTLVVAIVGATVAVYGAVIAARERTKARARSLAALGSICGAALKLASKPLPAGSDTVDDPALLPLTLVRERIHRVRALDAVARELKAQDMPTANAYVLVARVRATTALLLELAERALEGAAVTIDLGPVWDEAITTAQDIRQEAEHLWPVYEIGRVWLSASVERP